MLKELSLQNQRGSPHPIETLLPQLIHKIQFPIKQKRIQTYNFETIVHAVAYSP